MKHIPFYPALESKMVERGISKSDISSLIGVSQKSAYNKFSGKTKFTWDEVVSIKNQFFPEICLEDLMRTRQT